MGNAGSGPHLRLLFGNRSDRDPVRCVGRDPAVPGPWGGAAGAAAAALGHAGEDARSAGGGQLDAEVAGVEGTNAVGAGRLLLAHQDGDNESPGGAQQGNFQSKKWGSEHLLPKDLGDVLYCSRTRRISNEDLPWVKEGLSPEGITGRSVEQEPMHCA